MSDIYFNGRVFTTPTNSTTVGSFLGQFDVTQTSHNLVDAATDQPIDFGTPCEALPNAARLVSREAKGNDMDPVSVTVLNRGQATKVTIPYGCDLSKAASDLGYDTGLFIPQLLTTSGSGLQDTSWDFVPEDDCTLRLQAVNAKGNE